MESVVRGLVMYTILLVVFRLAGKRTLSEISSFDLVLLLIISETTQQAMIGNDFSVTNAIIAILTLLVLDLILSWVKAKSPLIDRWMDSVPVIIVQDGRLLAAAANAERID